jgi:SNF2 family DNA or RNA helicase
MVVITSYETISRDSNTFKRVQWNRIICDEAHHLRNPKTKTYDKIQSFQTRVFWCLTGTPIHNSPKDLASLFSLCKIERSEWKYHFLQRFQEKTNPNSNYLAKIEKTEMIEWKNERERAMAKDIHASIPC